MNIKNLFRKKRAALNDACQRAFNHTLKEFRQANKKGK